MFLQEGFPITGYRRFRNRRYFTTMINCFHRGYPKISVVPEILLPCFLCKNISYNFRRLAMFYLKRLYSKTLDVSMMNRDWPILLQEFWIRWQFVIVNRSQTSLMQMLYFVILMALKHPNQWAVIKLCVKKGIHFFYLGFLSRTFTIHRTAGEGEGVSSTPLFNFCLLLAFLHRS